MMQLVHHGVSCIALCHDLHVVLFMVLQLDWYIAVDSEIIATLWAKWFANDLPLLLLIS